MPSFEVGSVTACEFFFDFRCKIWVLCLGAFIIFIEENNLLCPNLRSGILPLRSEIKKQPAIG
jgi:hypothetical protein